MQIGRPQISFYSILGMANLGSKAREKGQNYKDLGLLPPLSLSSTKACTLLRLCQNIFKFVAYKKATNLFLLNLGHGQYGLKSA